MRCLFLLRHAKSSWQDDGQDDVDRPLNARGRKAVPVTAAFLHRNGLFPDLILCSTACRTRETLALVLPFLQGEATILLEDRLYLASAAKLFNRLHEIDDRFRRVMIVAHNPGLQDLALMLAANGADDDMTLIQSKFPTAALAQIDFRTESWPAVMRRSGMLVRFITPRVLASDATD
jgi:phosphohistidine phosphatase